MSVVIPMEVAFLTSLIKIDLASVAKTTFASIACGQLPGHQDFALWIEIALLILVLVFS